MDRDSSPVSSVALENTVILRHVFQWLNVPELLNLSRVSKLWRREALCLLRDRGKVVGHIQGPSSCRIVQDILQRWSRMPVIPFSELKLTISGNRKCGKQCVKVMPDQTALLLGELSLQLLVIDWFNLRTPQCPVLEQFVLKLMATVAQIKILRMPQILFVTPKNSCQQLFRRLKFVELPHANMLEQYIPKHIIRTLLYESPNLEEIKSAVSVDVVRHIAYPKLGIVKALHVWTYDDPALLTLVGPILKLKRLEIEVLPTHFSTNPQDDNNQFWPAVGEILEGSSQTLESVQVDAISAIMLTKLRVPLKHVKQVDLCLGFSEFRVELPASAFLRQFDLSSVFPKVDSVSIVTLPWILTDEDVVNIVGDINLESQVFPWPSVTQLNIRTQLTESIVAYLAPMFPNVRTVTMQQVGGTQAWKSMWNSWPCLESVRMSQAKHK